MARQHRRSGVFEFTILENRLLFAGFPLTSIPRLDSFPAASADLFLDFRGDAGQAWGAYTVPATPAYDQDGDPTTFSVSELDSIRAIWARVAEKYSPFNINVTTVDPGSYADRQALRVVIGGNGAWYGPGYGGLSYVGSFTNSSPNVSWIFSKNLTNGDARYVGDAAAHEAGHGFGLEHQAEFDPDGKLVTEYYAGTADRAPIMGRSYAASRGLWWNGLNAGARMQDELAILSSPANGFGYRPDDRSNLLSGAGPAVEISATSSIAGSGVITRTSDTDYFSFGAGDGPVSISLGAIAGGMLDAKLSLYNVFGILLKSVDVSQTTESLTKTLTNGTYYVAVSSHGGYGDVGQYTFSGTVAPPGLPGAPDSLKAVMIDPTNVRLTWDDNATNEGEYRIERSTDGVAWTQFRALGANATITTSTITSGTPWYFRVRAYNTSGNSAFSNIVTVNPAPLLTAVIFSSTPIITSPLPGADTMLDDSQSTTLAC